MRKNGIKETKDVLCNVVDYTTGKKLGDILVDIKEEWDEDGYLRTVYVYAQITHPKLFKERKEKK